MAQAYFRAGKHGRASIGKTDIDKTKNRVEIYKNSLTLNSKPQANPFAFSGTAQAQNGKNIERLFPALLTSELTPKNYFEEWQKSGTENAIDNRHSRRHFANLINLDYHYRRGHSPHYKSWDMMPYYHAKTTALKLAELCGRKQRWE